MDFLTPSVGAIPVGMIGWTFESESPAELLGYGTWVMVGWVILTPA